MQFETKKKVFIPEISDKQLLELSKRIKPVFTFPRKGLCFIKPCDLRQTAYTWDPKAAKPARKLKKMSDIRTYHKYGHPSLFKPSIAEIIAQIPANDLKKVVAFEIIDEPGSVADINANSEAAGAGYHVATTRLYTR